MFVSLISSGREFQSRGAVILKAWSLSVTTLYQGTASTGLVRGSQVTFFNIRINSSVIYQGARPCWPLKVITRIIISNLNVNGSQRREERIAMMWDI